MLQLTKFMNMKKINNAFLTFQLFFVIIVFCGICGCNSKSVPVPIVVAKPTKPDWSTALNASHVITDLKDDGNGITEYRSVFSAGENKSMDVFVTRDAFRKIRHWKTRAYNSIKLGEMAFPYEKLQSTTTLSFFIALPDYGLPILVSESKYIYKSGSPIGLSKLSILVANDLVLEKDMRSENVSVEINENYNLEINNMPLNDAEVDQLRKVKKDQTVYIRISGADKYVNVNVDDAMYSVIDESLFVYDKLMMALKDKIPEKK